MTQDPSYCWPACQEQVSAGSWVTHMCLVIPLPLPSWSTGTSKGLRGLYRSHDKYKAYLEASGSAKRFSDKGFSFSFINTFAAAIIHVKEKIALKTTPAEQNSHAELFLILSIFLPLCTNKSTENRFVHNKGINPANLLICLPSLCLSQHCVLTGVAVVLMCTAVQQKPCPVMFGGVGHGDSSSHRLLCL